MSDLLLRYLLTACARDRSRWRRLLHRRADLLSATVLAQLDSAAARVRVRVQYEQRHTVEQEQPVSRQHTIQFVERARPARPLAPHFRVDQQVFSLRKSLRTRACGDCSGLGTVPCGDCPEESSKHCAVCDNTRTRPCGRCEGDGRLACWTDEVFTYTVEDCAETIHPDEPEARQVTDAVNRWMDNHAHEPLERFTRPAAEAHLGYHSVSVSSVCMRAAEHEERLVADLSARPGRVLFHRVTRLLAPVRQLVIRPHDRPRRYWLVGQGDDAIERLPTDWPSPLRMLLLAGLIIAAVATLSIGVPLDSTTGTDASSLPRTAEWWWPLLPLTLCGLAILKMVWPSPQRFRALLVLRDTVTPTPWLPCLAAVGSHVGAAHSVDHTHEALLNAIHAPPQRDGLASLLALRLANERGVRLLERSAAAPLAPDTLRRLVRTLDGIICLSAATPPDDPLWSTFTQHPALRARVHHVRWSTSHPAAPDALNLERIRADYVAGTVAHASWSTVLQTLWSPLVPFMAPPEAPARSLESLLASDRPVLLERSSMRWLSKLLSPAPKARTKVPILGVEGCGKSALIVTIAQFVSLHEHGHVTERSLELFAPMLAAVQAGRPLDATVGYSDFEVQVRRVSERDGTLTDVDLVLSSEDIPGQDFRMLVGALASDPELAGNQGDASNVLERFGALLSECAGFVFVIDLLRGCTAEEFRAEPRGHTWAAYSDQVKPIMTGLLLASQVNPSLANKPIFFVLSKPDLHRLPIEQLESDFRRAMAIPLGALRARGARVRLYSVQCAGWRMDSNLEGLGVDDLIADLAHAVGAVATPHRG